MAEVELQDVSKVYPGGVEGVSSLSLRIRDGERVAIVGPSGSGKSTILRLIAGLEEPTQGSVVIAGQRVNSLPPRDRDVAMVFQHPALFPHLSVFENLAFGLKARGARRAEIADRVEQAAALLGLDRMLGRRPSQLSGGERQRVALGRAIVRRPRVFLLDEPFSSLDAGLRTALRRELLELHARLNATMIHVTHDQAEALAVGERVAVVERGRLVQLGTAEEVYRRPASRFVATFLGSPPVSILKGVFRDTEIGLCFCPDGTELHWAVAAEDPVRAAVQGLGGGRVELALRPEHAVVRTGGQRTVPGEWNARAEIRRMEPTGHDRLVTLLFGPHELVIRAANEPMLRVGECVELAISPKAATWFDPQSGIGLMRESSGDPTRVIVDRGAAG